MNKILGKIWITAFAVMICAAFTGCGGDKTSTGGDTQSTTGNAENGNMKVSLVWDDGAVSAVRSVSSVPSTVSTVRLKVSSAQKSVNTTQDFATSSGSGQMDALPAATDYSVTAQGLGSTGDLLYEGTATGVAVSAKNTTSLQITMKAVGVGSISVDWSTETTTSTTSSSTTSTSTTTTTTATTTTTTVSPVTVRKVPDTGQTSSYSTTFGEDHDYTINPPSYTNNGNGTVTDNVTGLMWQRTDDGTVRAWADAGAYCDNLTLAGFTDWRLPEVKELTDIVNYGASRPAIDATVFPEMNEAYYWSSTSGGAVDWQSTAFGMGDSSDAGKVFFGAGHVGYDDKSYSFNFFVICVRGTAVVPSLTDNGNGTVTDKVTGMTWQRQDDGTKRTWEQAISYCEALSLGGKTDWRLPNVKELKSLVDYTRYDPAIDTTAFPVTQSLEYWSSTSSVQYSSTAWNVWFKNGWVSNDEKLDNFYVRCVRGWQ